jgi:hypothetical protein
MIDSIFLATNNHGKVERFKKLLACINPDIKIFTPIDLGLETINPEENGKDLRENALIKARSYIGKVPMSILSNDSGFWVDGEGLIEAPKRIALGDLKEEEVTKEQKRDLLISFWKGIATKYGGKVDSAWVEEFAFITPNGVEKTAGARREEILTNEEFGVSHIELPVRAMYISKATGKPAVLHSEEEELVELKPLTDAITSLLNS